MLPPFMVAELLCSRNGSSRRAVKGWVAAAAAAETTAGSGAAGLLPGAHEQLLRADSIQLFVDYEIPPSVSKKGSATQFSMKRVCCTWVFVFHNSNTRHPDSEAYPEIQK